MKIGSREFDFGKHTYIMGILNVTPDSFSDGGRFNSLDKALFHTEEMVNEGVDIIDVGGESTRPGYTLLSDEEEISRIVPVIERLKKEFDVPVSLDTYKGNVAKEGIKAGADLINDIWGLKYDDILAKVIAENNVACCLMHNRKDTDYKDFISDVVKDLQETLDIAHRDGIQDDKIILDPGIGFAKTYEQNLLMLKNLSSLHELKYPLLLGASRKSVVGLTLGLPADERVEGTITTSIMAVLADYDFVRVHDIKENLRAIKMAEAIKYAKGEF
ncbi:dihydropteroate synthase [uncultured Megamonas sp.]|uniref:dihydropteroate synthase n=1 Tax=uncultured Megamonas sp. TaxID=286140 RepID=UPI0025EFFA97|nr:dihydropteroate synthase [uncultured Megamonas sp.]